MIDQIKTWLSSLIASWYHWLALAHRYWGHTRGLREEYEAAVQNFDRALLWNPQAAHIYLERGILWWRELNHPRKAVQDFTIALKLDPDLIEAHFNRGIAYQQLQEYQEAVSDFETYLNEGTHPHWRKYARTMIRELNEWLIEPRGGN
ncbi:MAG: tetratricopeptide repeat protein [Anaerolineales bacterium]